MKYRRALLLPLVLVPVLAVMGCNDRTDKAEGNVVLVAHIQTFPRTLQLSVPDSFRLPDTVTLENRPKNPLDTSNLQDVEMRSYQVTYRRRDTGTRTPTPLLSNLPILVPVNGSTTIGTLSYVIVPQLVDQPFKDLLDFGVDRETGSAVIVMDVFMQFFGRTVSGDDVATEPISFTVNVSR